MSIRLTRGAAPSLVARESRPCCGRFATTVVLCLLAGLAGAESRRDRLAMLDAINERWAGADCALRVPFEFKQKDRDNGWYESVPIIARRQVQGIGNLTYRLKLRDLGPLQGAMATRHLVAGTLFRCDGWKFHDEDGYDNAYLALRSAAGDVEAELKLKADAIDIKLGRVEEIEQYLRLAVFDVRARREVLRPSAPAPPAAEGASPAPGRVADAQGPSAGGVYEPRLQVLAVAVDPPQVTAGGQVELVVHYSVDGLPPNAAFEVSETRRLLRDEEALAETSEVLARANGAYTSSQTAPIPESAPRGVYRLEVVLRLAGVEASGTALFEVR